MTDTNDIIMGLYTYGYYEDKEEEYIYFIGNAALTEYVSNAIWENIYKTLDYHIKLGTSNVSESEYLTVTFENENDIYGSFKLRISAHGDRYGSDATLRVDDLYHYEPDDEEINREILDAFFVYNYAVQEMITSGVEMINEAHDKAVNNITEASHHFNFRYIKETIRTPVKGTLTNEYDLVDCDDHHIGYANIVNNHIKTLDYLPTADKAFTGQILNELLQHICRDANARNAIITIILTTDTPSVKQFFERFGFRMETNNVMQRLAGEIIPNNVIL